MALVEVYSEDRPRIEMHDDYLLSTREDLKRSNDNIYNCNVTLELGIMRKEKEQQKNKIPDNELGGYI